jgi:DNA-binding NarL/FixJ family response regulator
MARKSAGSGPVAEHVGRRLHVLIADDHPLMLAGIRRTLERDDQLAVVGEARTGPELLELIARRAPDVVVMDLRMPGVNGTELLARLRSSWPAVKVVVLSAAADRASVERAMAAGASAYAIKTVEPSEVIELIKLAASGRGTFERRTPRPLGGRRRRPDEPALTNREQVVLAAIASGRTTAEISRDLWVSEQTVKFHLTNIYRKLGVSNRAGAIRYALEHELVAA